MVRDVLRGVKVRGTGCRVGRCEFQCPLASVCARVPQPHPQANWIEWVTSKIVAWANGRRGNCDHVEQQRTMLVHAEDILIVVCIPRQDQPCGYGNRQLCEFWLRIETE
jgi:hypothetical protein